MTVRPATRRLVGLAMALATLTAAGASRAEDGSSRGTPTASKPANERPASEPADAEGMPMRYPPSSVRWPLILGGIGFSAIAYGVTAGVGAAWPDAPGASSLYLPLVGPWVALGKNGCPAAEPDCGAIVYVRGALEIVSGLAQLGGLVVAAEGILATTEAPKAETSRFVVLPSVGAHHAGLAVGGSF